MLGSLPRHLDWADYVPDPPTPTYPTAPHAGCDGIGGDCSCPIDEDAEAEHISEAAIDAAERRGWW